MKKKALLIGGAGFIGLNITKYLAENRDYEITIADTTGAAVYRVVGRANVQVRGGLVLDGLGQPSVSATLTALLRPDRGDGGGARLVSRRATATARVGSSTRTWCQLTRHDVLRSWANPP